MYAVGRLGSYISRGVYTVSGPFHPFGGAVDIIVVEQPDGSFKSSPWYIKFGKFQGVLKTSEKVVNISINGVDSDLHMFLNHKGEAYFLMEGGEVAHSPSSSGDEIEGQTQVAEFKKSQSLEIDQKHSDSVVQAIQTNGKIQKRSRLFSFMFGRKYEVEQQQNCGNNTPRASSFQRAELAADLLDVKWSTNIRTDRAQEDRQMPEPSSVEMLVDHDMVKVVEEANTQQVSIVKDVVKVLEVSKNVKLELNNQASDPPDMSSITTNDARGNGYPFLASEKYSTGALTEYDQVTHTKSTFISQLVDGHFKHCTTDSIGLDMIASFSKEVDVDCSVEMEDFGSRWSSEAVPIHVSEEAFSISRAEFCNTSICDGSDLIKEHIGDDLSHQEHSEVENFEVSKSCCKAKTDSSSPDIGSPQGQNRKTCRTSCGDPKLCTEILVSGVYIESKPAECLNVGNSVALDNKTSFVDEPKAVVLAEKCLSRKSLEAISLGHTEVSPQNNPGRVCTPSLVTDDTRTAILENLLLPDNINRAPKLYDDTKSSFSCMLPHTKPSCYCIGELESVVNGNQVKHECNKNNNAAAALNSLPLVGEDQLNSHSSSCICRDEMCHDTVGSCRLEIKAEMDDELHAMTGDTSFSSIQQSFESPLSCISNSFIGEHRQELELADGTMRTSAPMSIPRSLNRREEAEELAGSLPNILFQNQDSEHYDVRRCQSWSPATIDETSKWGMFRANFPGMLELSASSSSVMQQQYPIAKVSESRALLEGEHAPSGHPVEISLCKDLLFEGMGAEAARQAFDSGKLSMENFVSLGPAIVKDNRLIVRLNEHYFSWESAAPIILGMVSFGSCFFEQSSAINVQQSVKPLGDEAVVASGSWSIWPFNLRKSKSIPPGSSSHILQEFVSKEKIGSQDGTASPFVSVSAIQNDLAIQGRNKSTKQRVRYVVPTSNQLASLNLMEGCNAVVFTFSTPMLGKQQVDARIYLWKWNAKIVISDVDGTITRSDVLGQFMPLVGKDWSQSGVARLFSAIKENGYQLLFLSARAISQSNLTRQFLFNLKQDGKVLPDGPVVMSPDGLFPSLYREVVRRAPHEFKIACLENIRKLFPADCSPFYAGFGNRETDEISYLKVGVPKGKIFIVNPKGEILVNKRIDTKSYASLHDLVDEMFPTLSLLEEEDFNSWNYWKLPLQVVVSQAL